MILSWNGIAKRYKFCSVILISQKTDKARPSLDGENEEGRRALMTIKGKLGGHINKEELPLSVEGQVDELIRMAVSPERLVAMYIGLSPVDARLTN